MSSSIRIILSHFDLFEFYSVLQIVFYTGTIAVQLIQQNYLHFAMKRPQSYVMKPCWATLPCQVNEHNTIFRHACFGAYAPSNMYKDIYVYIYIYTYMCTVILMGPFWPQRAVLASWMWGHFGSTLGPKQNIWAISAPDRAVLAPI